MAVLGTAVGYNLNFTRQNFHKPALIYYSHILRCNLYFHNFTGSNIDNKKITKRFVMEVIVGYICNQVFMALAVQALNASFLYQMKVTYLVLHSIIKLI